MEDILIHWKDMIYCQKDTHIKAIAALFLNHKIGSIVVFDKKQPVGIITKTDMLVPHLKPSFTHAYQIMNSNLVYVERSDSIPLISSIMIDRKIHHVLVREEGKLIGMLSSTDIVSYLVKQDEAENASFVVELSSGKRKLGSQWEAILQDEDYDVWASKL
eukprot:gene9404-1612_t